MTDTADIRAKAQRVLDRHRVASTAPLLALLRAIVEHRGAVNHGMQCACATCHAFEAHMDAARKVVQP
jgi:hypothetical protein